MLIVATCTNRSGPIMPEQYFSDLTSMTGKRFVAYTSPDPKTKPDTVEFSWNHPGIDSRSVSLTAFLDSGATQILLTGIAATGTSSFMVQWVPGDDTLRFGFFGVKECVLELADWRTGRSARSDPFTIIGSRPFVLVTPSGGERYSMNDSVAVNYQINTDRISNISVFFKNDYIGDWIEISGTTKRTADTPPLRSFTTLFIPRTWASLIAGYPGIPIRFFLKDYNSPLPDNSIISGDVFVE